MNKEERITDESAVNRKNPDCKINQDGTCGECGNDLNVNLNFDGAVEFYNLICSECGSHNQVSQLRLQEADNE